MLPGPPFRSIALKCLLVIPLILGPAAALSRQGPVPAPSPEKSFYCPMHPDLISAKPGKCQRCGMALRAGLPPARAGTSETRASNAADSPDIPDIAVLDQNGNKLSFYSDLVKGRTVAISFIFTTCTTICPPMTATMRRVQQQLGDVAARNIQLVSVTVDPVTDVPARLKAFAEKFGAQPGWTFVTGSKNDIDRLLRALGAYVSDPASHSPIVLIGNDQARYWTRSYGLASPSALRSLIVEAAAKSAAEPIPGSSAHK